MVASTYFTDRHSVATAITAAKPVVVTVTSHGFSSGQTVRATKFSSTTGMQELNERLFYVQFPTTNTFQLYEVYGQPIDGSGYTAFISGGQFTLTGPSLDVKNIAT